MPLLIFSLAIFLTLLNPAAVIAQKRQQLPINFVNQYKQAQEKRADADNKLIDNMEATADWLVKFHTRNGHFPFVGTEEDRAIDYLQKRLLKANPYTITGVASDQEKKTICPVRFIHDIGLTDAQRVSWEKSPPGNWRGEPGAITIITNEYDLAIVWGVGADHNPVVDAKNNKYYLAWRSFSK